VIAAEQHAPKGRAAERHQTRLIFSSSLMLDSLHPQRGSTGSMPRAGDSAKRRQPTRGSRRYAVEFSKTTPRAKCGQQKTSDSRQRPSGDGTTCGRIRSLEGSPVRRVTGFLPPPFLAARGW
jgi:hypothetical protein